MMSITPFDYRRLAAPDCPRCGERCSTKVFEFKMYARHEFCEPCGLKAAWSLDSASAVCVKWDGFRALFPHEVTLLKELREDKQQ